VSKTRESHKQALRQLLDRWCVERPDREELIDEILRVNDRFDYNLILDARDPRCEITRRPSLTLVREHVGIPMSVPPGAVLMSEETARALDESAGDSPTALVDVSGEALLDLYCRVMGEARETFVEHESYVVRVWDGMDSCWTDCTGAVDRDEALRTWAARTDGGARAVSYDEIDYYRIFPGNTRMLWDGSEGREMHR
jgi:hypothetical protein